MAKKVQEEKQPLVSVIIPVYNASKTIGATLDSVLNQTYKNLEILAVNDCSTDDSLKILEEYAKKDKRLKVLTNPENLRVAKTRNFAIEKATGDYIAFVDADDIWDLTKLEKQLAFMKENGCKLCYTSVDFIDNDGNETGRQFIVPEKVWFNKLLKQNVITLSSACAESEIIKKHLMHNDELHEDFIMWLEILRDEIKYAYGLREVLVHYRLTTGSKSRNKFKSMKMTYKTYRLLKVNFFKAHFCLFIYVLKSLKKYGKEAVKK